MSILINKGEFQKYSAKNTPKFQNPWHTLNHSKYLYVIITYNGEFDPRSQHSMYSILLGPSIPPIPISSPPPPCPPSQTASKSPIEPLIKTRGHPHILHLRGIVPRGGEGTFLFVVSVLYFEIFVCK